MKTSYNLLILILTLLFVLSSCRKEENKTDSRDQLIGRYLGNDSSMGATTYHPYAQPGYLVNADSSVKEIEIIVSKGANDSIYISYNKNPFPASFAYKGYSYRFYFSLGSESYSTRSLQFSQDAASLTIRDTTIGVTYYGNPDQPDASRYYGRSYIHTLKQ